MKSVLAGVLALGALIAAEQAHAAEPVQVMVLGTYHFGNPGRDVNNATADDVLSPRRQGELGRLSEELARFRPTRIMVERVGQGADLKPKSWGEFNPDKLQTDRDEAVQIAYRLAHRLKIPVHGIDERDREGEETYFPYDKLMAFADKQGRKAELGALNDPVQAHIRKFEAAQKTQSLPALLAMWNDPASAIGGMSFYYGALNFADGPDTPGANLNARWYLRNARIFTNLMRQSKSGDRVLVVFGSGHGYWLRHFARETPGYLNVDPMPYLKRAATRR